MENKNNLQDNQTYAAIRNTVLTAKNKVYSAVNSTMVEAYWEIGKEIVVAQGKEGRAEYGKGLLKQISKALTDEFGKGFEERNLRYIRQFYLTFQNWNTVCSKLSWSHYRLLMKIENEEKRG